ncbi:uncharacterized protein [Euwallacea fornicatus]|uniref:uncharacterized protein n=1 Tax=Euwallacea fornicatus TaxID=995702 RepID=UPI00338DFA62
MLQNLENLLLLLSLSISLVLTYPADNAGNQSDKVIFVPYDVKYVPIELPSEPVEELRKTLNHEENSKEDSKSGQNNITVLEGLLKDTFEVDRNRDPEDYVLVPFSVLKQLQEKREGHKLIKRQGGELKPLIEHRALTRNKRRILKPPPLVGYLNNYDLFPTVA